MNYFGSQASAEKYSKGRPHFHSNTINHIKEFLRIEDKLDNALDIACGTGLSTQALLPITRNVYGTDISEEMLKIAPNRDKINYSIAPAEEQPFADKKFDLITVSSGVHWFNIDKFLFEASRILKQNGWLVIYENFFAGNMAGKDDFKTWTKEVYLNRFPSPPRNKNYEWTAENLSPKNLALISTESFENEVIFSKRELTDYFITQSNVVAAVEQKGATYAEIENWLDNELSAFFENDSTRHTFYYGNWIKYLQKV